MFKEVLNELLGDVSRLMQKDQTSRDLVIAIGFLLGGACLPSTFLYVPTQTAFSSYFSLGFDWFVLVLIGYILILIRFASKNLHDNPQKTRKVLIYLGAASFALMAYFLDLSAEQQFASQAKVCLFTDSGSSGSDMFGTFLGLSKSQLASMKDYCAALRTQKITYFLGLGGFLYLAAMAKVIHAGLRIKSTGN